MEEVYASGAAAATRNEEAGVMPNRLVREGLMESERVLSVPVEARWLFVIVMLSADDMGLFEATEFKLARRADVRRELAGKLMQMLADVDLVRFYDADGRRYGFIPRFRQRLQIKRSKHPLPPPALMRDDDDAIGKAAALIAARETGELAGAFGKQWEELRLRVFERDGYRCLRCGSQEDLTAHHLTPKSKGGKHTLDNLTTLCGSCNSWARNNNANCNEIKDLTIKTASVQYLDSDDADAAQPSEPEPEPKSNTPHTPRRGAAVGLLTWLETVKGRGEKPIPTDDPVFAYAAEVGIPREFLHLAWLEFRHRYGQPNAKRYRDWRSVFRNAVRGNWFKLWYLDGQQYALTTTGMQAQRAHQPRAAA